MKEKESFIFESVHSLLSIGIQYSGNNTSASVYTPALNAVSTSVQSYFG